MADEKVLRTTDHAKFLQERLMRTWENLSKIKCKIAVMSGKGGVGKTTVSVCLASILAEKSKVGLLDADIDCPNVNAFLGIKERLNTPEKNVLLPLEKNGLKVVSMASLQEADDTPIMWRGPLIANTLAQFLESIKWGELDYLFFDSPPGTSDVAVSLMQNVGLTGIVVVSTPQKVSLVDCRKTINMARQFKIPILGLVENMSGSVFGKGSVEALAKEQGLAFLGRVSLGKKLALLAEKGKLPPAKGTNERKEFEGVAQSLHKIILEKK